MANSTTLQVRHLPGLVDYNDALLLQRELHARRCNDDIPDTLLLLEHPAVYTAGRRTQDFERPRDGTPVIEADRGGRITWHGPGQLVGYPIVRLPQPLDLVAHVRRMEAGLIAACDQLGVTTSCIAGRTGVWVAGHTASARKIAAIGVRVARGVTMHGFALNCDNDLAPFAQIVACGIEDASVTTLSAELAQPISVNAVLPVVEQAMMEHLLGTPVSPATAR
ncbi:MAG TPA: lipoate-protein ligase B [Actinobacteria bacterium]|nr:lipoate-protein ligase B [Actinomycetota bacterium]